MITSLANSEIKAARLLLEKSRARRKEGRFVIEGIRIFEEVPENRIVKVLVSEECIGKLQSGNVDRGASVLEKLKRTGYEVVADDIFKKMSDTITPQGILTIVSIKENTGADMVKGDDTLIVILENLQDPGNLGTIVRTAEAAGVTGIIMSKDCVDIYNPKVVRSTMGGIFRVPFMYTEDLHSTMKDLQSKNVTLYAADLFGSEVYDSFAYKKATAFLIGNEGNGLLRETAEASDKRVFLPMEGKVESLNASVAASVLMYEAYRQRRK